MADTIQRDRPDLIDSLHREIFLAGGCFWGMQQYLMQIPGVIHTSVGYANGLTPNPTYEAVCQKNTGYAETVHVIYDVTTLSLQHLLKLYFQSIDPTSLDRQGNDYGSQYRTGIYYTNLDDLPTIRAEIHALAQTLSQPVVIQVESLFCYYLAEDYHQNYLDKNPGGYCHIPAALMEKAANAYEYQKPAASALEKSLTPLQYEVTQKNATEPPFQNEYHDHFAPGIYVDITTGEPLFLSTDKFASGCGWPTFSKPITPDLLRECTDDSRHMHRTEVRSKSGDAHLGHVFDDGPAELGGLRYCINSAALRFIAKAEMQQTGYGHLLHLFGPGI